MDFNNTTTYNGLIQDCERNLGMARTTISSDADLLKDFTVLLNEGMFDTIGDILEAQQGWHWDDTNYTDFPRGTQNLVASQNDYALPTANGTYNAANSTTLLHLNGISVLDSNEQEVPLEPTEMSDADLNRIYATDGMPKVYKKVSNSVKVWPAPAAANVTTTNGFIAYFQRTQDEFTSADTTQQPGIPRIFHRLISIRASIKYAIPRTLESLKSLRDEEAIMVSKLKKFFSRRDTNAELGLDKPKFINYR